VLADDPLPPDEPLAQRVRTGLAKIGIALKQQAWAEAGSRGLTPTQGQVLALLRASPDGLRLGVLAQQLGVTQPAASDSVAALARKNLVKTPLAGDGRAVLLQVILLSHPYEGWACRCAWVRRASSSCSATAALADRNTKSPPSRRVQADTRARTSTPAESIRIMLRRSSTM
jgi:hypothetical protein